MLRSVAPISPWFLINYHQNTQVDSLYEISNIRQLHSDTYDRGLPGNACSP